MHTRTSTSTISQTVIINKSQRRYHPIVTSCGTTGTIHFSRTECTHTVLDASATGTVGIHPKIGKPQPLRATDADHGMSRSGVLPLGGGDNDLWMGDGHLGKDV